MREDLISVIVPVYNVRDYVPKCLRSLRRQSYKNLEIIVVDDGSTDDSGEICDEIAATDGRFKVYHKKNGGLSDARNFGIARSRGKYLLLVDGDDFVAKDYALELWRAVRQDGVDIAMCGHDDRVPHSPTITGKQAAIRLLTRQENMDVVVWNKIYRREMFDNISYPVGEMHEDNLTTYKVLAEARHVAFVEKSLYTYVERKGSIMSMTRTDDRLRLRERAAREAIQYFRDEPELKAAAKISLLLAKYAWVDASLRSEVAAHYAEDEQNWIRKNYKQFYGNQFLSWKLKLYIVLTRMHFYRLFRMVMRGCT